MRDLQVGKSSDSGDRDDLLGTDMRMRTVGYELGTRNVSCSSKLNSVSTRTSPDDLILGRFPVIGKFPTSSTLAQYVAQYNPRRTAEARGHVKGRIDQSRRRRNEGTVLTWNRSPRYLRMSAFLSGDETQC